MKLTIGTLVQINSKPCSWIPEKSRNVAETYELSMGKMYPIVEIKACSTGSCGRPWCPGLLRINGMKAAECWGYSKGNKKWFGLTTTPTITLDDILGLYL